MESSEENVAISDGEPLIETELSGIPFASSAHEEPFEDQDEVEPSGIPLVNPHEEPYEDQSAQGAETSADAEPLIEKEPAGIPLAISDLEDTSPDQGPVTPPGKIPTIPEEGKLPPGVVPPPPKKRKSDYQFRLIGIDDTPRGLGRALVSEFIGIAMLVGIGIGLANPIVLGSLDSAQRSLYVPAIVIGGSLTVGAMIHICIHASGGHVNPSVTLALFLDQRISLLRCVTYLLSQFAGGVAGAGLIYVLCNYHNRPKTNFGLIAYDLDTYTYPQVFFNEVFGTMLLNLVVYVSFVEKNNDAGSYKQCLSISIVCMVVNPMCCINPARGLAFNLITLQKCEHIWVSVLGPFVGAALAALIYKSLLKSPRRPYLVEAK